MTEPQVKGIWYECITSRGKYSSRMIRGPRHRRSAMIEAAATALHKSQFTVVSKSFATSKMLSPGLHLVRFKRDHLRKRPLSCVVFVRRVMK